MNNTETSAALVVKRILPYPPQPLFNALSDPSIMSKWFFAGPDAFAEVNNDFRMGGEFEIVMHMSKDIVRPHKGIYKEIIQGKKIVFTWNSDSATDTLVTIELEKNSEGTALTLTHEFLSEKARDGHNKGWNACFDNLVQKLPILKD